MTKGELWLLGRGGRADLKRETTLLTRTHDDRYLVIDTEDFKLTYKLVGITA